MSDEDRDRLFGILHSLAEKSESELENGFTEPNVLAVRELVTQFLVGYELPAEFTAASFAEVVYKLRANERAWSQRLGDTIIAAEDKLQVGDKDGALIVLDGYAKQCPWLSLKEIAEIEKENFRRS